jgi:hypothetical protein
MNLADTALQRIANAKRDGSAVSIVDSPVGCVIILSAPAAASESPADLIPEADAARLAATRIRTVRDARRTGELVAFGGQRDRSYRRGDVLAWAESRRAPVHEAIDDRDIDRRMARLGARG